ncbi:unnamed protein product [Acanthosepion pharaonis]|uniref:Uncharacterized protein n=1 Tax=Acanthosepion pharaonis TaxID=158019 RepID=A0A812EEL3_ACAPH|nr:unnamed protein product [Sepia pharaonis]
MKRKATPVPVQRALFRPLFFYVSAEEFTRLQNVIFSSFITTLDFSLCPSSEATPHPFRSTRLLYSAEQAEENNHHVLIHSVITSLSLSLFVFLLFCLSLFISLSHSFFSITFSPILSHLFYLSLLPSYITSSSFSTLISPFLFCNTFPFPFLHLFTHPILYLFPFSFFLDFASILSIPFSFFLISFSLIYSISFFLVSCTSFSLLSCTCFSLHLCLSPFFSLFLSLFLLFLSLPFSFSVSLSSLIFLFLSPFSDFFSFFLFSRSLFIYIWLKNDTIPQHFGRERKSNPKSDSVCLSVCLSIYLSIYLSS